MKRYLASSIFIFFFMTSQSQTNTFDSVVNRLQFHILTDNPDTCVAAFLKRCVPVLASKPKSKSGGWTSYSSEPIRMPQAGLLSIKVAQHPSLQCKHSGARFDILTEEWPNGHPGIKAFRVWFYFDNKADAQTALKRLVEMFEVTKTKVALIRKPESQTAMLYENEKDTWTSAILTLRKEKGLNPKYSILFTYSTDNGEPW
jgi:hypothetical protein